MDKKADIRYTVNSAYGAILSAKKLRLYKLTLE